METVEILFASADLFRMMGVVPTAGRTFRTEEDLEGVGNVVLLTHAYWLRQYGGEDVVGGGMPMRMPGGGWETTDFEILGVLPPDFRVPPIRWGPEYEAWTKADVVLPFGHYPGSGFFALAQLRDGVTVEQAQANLQSMAPSFEEGSQVGNRQVAVVPVGELLRQEYGRALAFLWAATALVLLVACAAVASLLLGWGVAREQELAVRTALGAGARRIFSQLLTEAAVLAAAGGVLGVLLAYWGIAALKLLTPAGVHRLDQVSLDVGGLLFTVGVSLATVLVVGLWPALRGARRPSSEVLKAGGRGATLARTRSLRVLVTAEVALSLVLLAGAGLMLQSFWNLVSVDTGFQSEWTVQIDVSYLNAGLSKYQPEGGRRGATASLEVLNLMRDRVEAIPGVNGFSRSYHEPLAGWEPGGYEITIAGRPHPEAGERTRAMWYQVSPGFFDALGIRLLDGIAFDIGRWNAQIDAARNATLAGQEPLGPDLQQVVISEAMAKAFWPGESAVGKIFYEGDHDPDVVAPGNDEFWALEVVGVVADLRQTLEREPIPSFYGPTRAGPILHVSTSVDPAGLVDVLRREIEAVDPNEIKVREIRTGEQIIAEQSADSRFRAQLIVFFAVMATGITCLGLFGVLTYAMAQRTRELGIRVALGAARSDIAGLVLGQGARMAGLGIALGLVLASLLARYVSSLLFGIAPLDPATLMGVSGLIFALALLAAYLPARRAMSVDPVETLQHE